MKESLKMMEEGKINPAMMITHVGGIDAVIDTTLNLPKIPGGKKLIYLNIHMPLVAISDFGASDDPVLREIDKIVKANNGIWCKEAEQYLLAHKN